MVGTNIVPGHLHAVRGHVVFFTMLPSTRSLHALNS
jgi:hypothetical protein